MLKWPRILTRLVTACRRRCRTKSAPSACMKSELITNVSHDLKTPLTSILNYSDLLGKDGFNAGGGERLRPHYPSKGSAAQESDERPVRYLQGAVRRKSRSSSGTAGCVHARPRQALAEQDKAVQERNDRQSRHSRAGAAHLGGRTKAVPRAGKP